MSNNTVEAGSLSRLPRLHKRHQFRLVLCGHKAVETGAACLLFMIQGELGQATLGHFLVASKTGALTVFPLLGITLTPPCTALCEPVDVCNICRRVRILRGRRDPRIALPRRLLRSSAHGGWSICVVRHPFLHPRGQTGRSPCGGVSAPPGINTYLDGLFQI